jgi:hypothetical protein
MNMEAKAFPTSVTQFIEVVARRLIIADLCAMTELSHAGSRELYSNV